MVECVLNSIFKFHLIFILLIYYTDSTVVKLESKLHRKYKPAFDLPLLDTNLTGAIDADIYDCYQKLYKFSNASAEFTRCAVRFARPINFCQFCIQQKENVKATYTAMRNKVCDNILFNADRIEIVDAVFSQDKTLWDNANCDNCYDLPDNKFLLKNSTTLFISLVTETQSCFLRNNVTICPLGINDTFCPNSACINCSSLYHNLTKVYKDLLDEYDFEDLCMDITDAMNITRKMWSNGLDCIHYSDDVFVLFTIISFVCLLPPVFYLGNWIQSDEQKSRIIPQSRLATSRSQAQLTGDNSAY